MSCQTMLLPLLVFLIGTTSAEILKKQYTIGKDAEPWWIADYECSRLGGHIASPSSFSDLGQYNTEHWSHYWTDWSDQKAEGTWVNKYGENPASKRWANGGRSHNCAIISSGGLDDVDCDRRFNYICEFTSVIVHKSGWGNWLGGSPACKADGGKLFTPKTLADLNLVAGHTSTFFTGWNDKYGKRGVFQDEDGNILPNNSPLWDTGEPRLESDTNRRHVVQYRRGKLRARWDAYGDVPTCENPYVPVKPTSKRIHVGLSNPSWHESWWHTEEMCNSLGGHTVTPRWHTELYNLGKDLTKFPAFWVGYSDEQTEGVWVDRNGNQLPSNVKWRSGEPNGGTKENCLLNAKDGFYDAICSERYPGLCEVQQEAPVEFKMRYYVLGEGKLPHAEAQEKCKQLGGHLAAPLNPKALTGVVPPNWNVYWVEWNDHQVEMQFKDINGLTITKNPKDWRSPDYRGGRERNCVSTCHGLFCDVRCSDRRNYVCEVFATIRLETDLVDITTAQEKCAKLGGKLATPFTQEDIKMRVGPLVQMTGVKGRGWPYAHIGWNDRKEEGKWVADGDSRPLPTTSDIWGKDEPRDWRHHDCTWIDAEHAYVTWCKREVKRRSLCEIPFQPTSAFKKITYNTPKTDKRPYLERAAEACRPHLYDIPFKFGRDRALGEELKPLWGSSTVLDGTWAHEKMFDGKENTCFDSGSVRRDSWVENHLYEIYPVWKVSILANAAHMKDLRVKVCIGIYRPVCKPCTTSQWTNSWTHFTCPDGITGDNIRFERDHGSIRICEVKVVGDKAQVDAWKEKGWGKQVRPVSGRDNGVYRWGGWGGYAALYDGGVNTKDAKQCYHSGSTDSPWVSFNLAEEQKILSVSLLNRGDCCGERLNGAKVKVCMDTSCQLCGDVESATTGQWVKVTCTGAPRGNVVRVEQTGNWLHFCEIKINAMKKTFWGADAPNWRDPEMQLLMAEGSRARNNYLRCRIGHHPLKYEPDYTYNIHWFSEKHFTPTPTNKNCKGGHTWEVAPGKKGWQAEIISGVWNHGESPIRIGELMIDNFFSELKRHFYAPEHYQKMACHRLNVLPSNGGHAFAMLNRVFNYIGCGFWLCDWRGMYYTGCQLTWDEDHDPEHRRFLNPEAAHKSGYPTCVINEVRDGKCRAEKEAYRGIKLSWENRLEWDVMEKPVLEKTCKWPLKWTTGMINSCSQMAEVHSVPACNTKGNQNFRIDNACDCLDPDCGCNHFYPDFPAL